MSKRVQLRRGTATQHNTFTGADGEVTVDTTNKTLKVHDGATVGGTALAKVSQLPASASATKQGLIEIATQTEVNAGTDSTRAIVPNTLLGGMKTHLSASGSAPIYACRAWANFDGTTGAIRASGNISSIVNEGGGTFLITFATAMPDANYSVVGTSSARRDATALAPIDTTLTADSFKIRANYGGDNTVGAYQPSICCITVFR